MSRKYMVYFRQKVGDKFEPVEALDLSDKDFKAVLMDALVEVGIFVGVKEDKEQTNDR